MTAPLSSQQSALLALVPADGSSVGITSLHEQLGWDKAAYTAVRDELIAAGLLEMGKGRGDSVKRVIGKVRNKLESESLSSAQQASVTPMLALHARAREIVNRHEATQERGELFNLLTVIRRGHLEVMTHSPILAELLRPQGSHGHGSTFLRLFLERVKVTDFTAEGATVGEEVSFGDLGRIDLVLKDRSGRQIFIENKIYAGLKERQLERYQEADPDAPVLYLTLNGDSPTQTDRTKVPNLKLVSYRDDIAAWLETCLNASIKNPTVHHAITQYRNLVMKLTRQNLSTKMTKELAAAALETVDSFRAFSATVKAKQEVQRMLADKLSSAVLKAAPDLNLSSVFVGSGQAYGDSFTQKITLSGNVQLEAEISFENAEFQDCYFGFRLRSGLLTEAHRTLLCNLFVEAFGSNVTTHSVWPAWAHWNVRDWGDDVWCRVINGELTSLAEDIVVTLRQLKTVGERFREKLE